MNYAVLIDVIIDKNSVSGDHFYLMPLIEKATPQASVIEARPGAQWETVSCLAGCTATNSWGIAGKLFCMQILRKRVTLVKFRVNYSWIYPIFSVKIIDIQVADMHK